MCGLFFEGIALRNDVVISLLSTKIIRGTVSHVLVMNEETGIPLPSMLRTESRLPRCGGRLYAIVRRVMLGVWPCRFFMCRSGV